MSAEKAQDKSRVCTRSCRADLDKNIEVLQPGLHVDAMLEKKEEKQEDHTGYIKTGSERPHGGE